MIMFSALPVLTLSSPLCYFRNPAIAKKLIPNYIHLTAGLWKI